MILATPVFVRRHASFVGLEKYHLRNAFIGIDLGRQWGRVGKLQCHKAFPFRLEGSHVYQNSTSCIGTFAETDCEHVSGDSEVLNSSRQCKAVRRNEDRLAFHVDEILGVKFFRVDYGAIDVCEKLELVCAADVVTVAGSPLRYDSSPIYFFNLVRFEWLNHVELGGHPADPFV